MNLEADSTSFLGQRPLPATSRGSGDETSAKSGLLGFELRPSLRTKLLMAFFVIEMLLVSVGLIGLLSLREADQRANQVVGLQQKIEAYRQMQHNTLRQLLWRIHSARLSERNDIGSCAAADQPVWVRP
ncbi:hypothetical protein ACVWW2_002964 [Bradyrhizobium sp. LM4.3]